MLKTLNDKDRLVLWTIGYHPEQGDIVVVDRYTAAPLIKRVIGLEGDTVRVEEDAVYVNGLRLEEPYLDGSYPNVPNGMEVTVPDGCVFVMGDNRNLSKDSRSKDIGLIDKREILGKAIFLFFPGSNGYSRDFARIGGVD